MKKVRETEEQESNFQRKRTAPVMIVSTPPSKDSRSMNRKRETKKGSPSPEAVSEANLTGTPPMVLAKRRAAAYRDNSKFRKLAEVLAHMESASGPVTEDDFKPQRLKIKRGSNNGQTMEVDVGSFFVDSPGHEKGSRELSEEAGSRSVRKAPELHHAAKDRNE